ncbi:hypothetical protein [Pseudomonas taetrolens]|nr:hypothetical protein [Pseudomonas taetrolens]SQF87876.1 Uncharacterised protein [Pseudomonas taetrolens]VEH51067.1 Uncharacterised protein [Pseudomonas taetrolens]
MADSRRIWLTGASSGIGMRIAQNWGAQDTVILNAGTCSSRRD